MPRVSSRAKHVDLFGNVAWDATRIKVQQKADEWRRQGFIGATMASHAELAYTGIVETLAAREKEVYPPQRANGGGQSLDATAKFPAPLYLTKEISSQWSCEFVLQCSIWRMLRSGTRL